MVDRAASDAGPAQIAERNAVGKSPCPRLEGEVRSKTLFGRARDQVCDNRGWHGATPNLSREIRALPDVEYGAPWLPTGRLVRTMPHEIWETLSPHAQAISRHVKAAPGVWPAGAGVMHPLLSGRREANAKSPGIANYK